MNCNCLRDSSSAPRRRALLRGLAQTRNTASPGLCRTRRLSRTARRLELKLYILAGGMSASYGRYARRAPATASPFKRVQTCDAATKQSLGSSDLCTHIDNAYAVCGSGRGCVAGPLWSHVITAGHVPRGFLDSAATQTHHAN